MSDSGETFPPTPIMYLITNISPRTFRLGSINLLPHKPETITANQKWAIEHSQYASFFEFKIAPVTP